MEKKYTVIIRKSELEYVAICLELNLSARGEDLADVEKNLRTAIELYQEDIKAHPETVVSSVSSEELIEFFQDTKNTNNSNHEKNESLKNTKSYKFLYVSGFRDKIFRNNRGNYSGMLNV
jgi:predicted RNase H-like HicB family nuclease